jgi:alpha-aminoadipate carrier protein LysW
LRSAQVVAIIPTLVAIAPAGAGFWHVIDPLAKPNAGAEALRRPMASCPECDADIEVDEFDVDKGDQLTCPDCGSSLEVTSLSPVELELAAEEDDDPEDDIDEDEEEDEDDEEETDED